MRYFYDTEFLEDGRTIDLISIGIVAEDGRKLYLVNETIDTSGALYSRIISRPWLMANVIPQLPVADCTPTSYRLDLRHPSVVTPREIRNQVKAFLLSTDQCELWAWYSAYDHVALAQLFGPMDDIPPGIPWWTNDLRQMAVTLGVQDEEKLLPRDGGQHNALADAEWNRELYWALTKRRALKLLGGGDPQ